MEFPAQKLNTPRKELQASARNGKENVYVEMTEQLRERKIDPKNPEDIKRALRLVEMAYNSMVFEVADELEFSFELPYEPKKLIDTPAGNYENFLIQRGERTGVYEYQLFNKTGKILASGSADHQHGDSVGFSGGYFFEDFKATRTKQRILTITDLKTGRPQILEGATNQSMDNTYGATATNKDHFSGQAYYYRNVKNDELQVYHPGNAWAEMFEIPVDDTINMDKAIVVNGKIYFCHQTKDGELLESKTDLKVGGKDCCIHELAVVDGKPWVLYSHKSKGVTNDYYLSFDGKEKKVDWRLFIGKKELDILRSRDVVRLFLECGYFVMNDCLFDKSGKKVASDIAMDTIKYVGTFDGKPVFRGKKKGKGNVQEYFIDDQGNFTAKVDFNPTVVGDKVYAVAALDPDKKHVFIVHDMYGQKVGEVYKTIPNLYNIGERLFYRAYKENYGMTIYEQGQPLLSFGEDVSSLIEFEGEPWAVKYDREKHEVRVFDKSNKQNFYIQMEMNNPHHYEKKSLCIKKIKGEVFVRWSRLGQAVCYEDSSGQRMAFTCAGLLPDNDKFLMMAINDKKIYPVSTNFNYIGEGYDQVFDQQMIDGELYVTGRRGTTIVREKVD